jgi:NAD(P)-dependent dehydrogenase (short-subunit alcohol dehydrogenase family)
LRTTVVVGGSNGLGWYIARRYADRGNNVIITSRELDRAREVAAEIGGRTRGLKLDLSKPLTLADALTDVSSVDDLIVTASSQHANSLREFDVEEAVRAVTIKLVGYTEIVRSLRDRFNDGASVVFFGGLAKDLPYPGSTIVTAFNGGISSLVKTLAIELAPHRINAIHPGVVGDSPKWKAVSNHPAIARTPIGRLVTMAEVAGATEFLLTNTGVNAIDLYVDGGMRVT